MQNKTKVSIEQFTTNNECMRHVAQLVINPAIYKNTKLSKIVDDFNKVFEANEVPYELIAPKGQVEYLRFEAERLDRALYILSCLSEPEA